MRSNRTKTAIAAAIILAGLLTVFAMSDSLERSKPPLPEGYEDQDLALQGSKLKGFSFGAEGLIADWYWTKALQYLGDKLVKSNDGDVNLDDLRPLNPRLLYPYLNSATDLDPQFIAVYSYGAVVLPAVDPEKAIAITKKGIENNPAEWRLYHYLGYIYWRLDRFEEAADIYERGAQIHGTPPFMRVMAAQMKTQGGSRETAREMYKEMLAGTDDEDIKRSVELRVLRLDALDDIDAINLVFNAFKEQTGHCTTSWTDVFTKLRAVKLASGRPLNFNREGYPVDPSGIPYTIITKDDACKVDLDPEKSKIPQR